MSQYASQDSTSAIAPAHSRSIPSLDGIRAISFLIVFLSHAGLGNVMPGGFGVTVFFFLSGFLITTLLRSEQARQGHIDLRAFYLRRCLRILPPFYAVIAFAVVLRATGLLSGRIEPLGLLAQVFHLGNYYLIKFGSAGIIAGTSVLWSLAVEEHFYLLFPAAYRLLVRATMPIKQAAMLLGVCGCCLAWRYVVSVCLHAPPGNTGYTYLATDTRFDSLLFGCILAIAANPVLDDNSILGRGRARLLAPFALAALLFTFTWRSQAFRDTLRYTIQGVALLPLFVVAITEQQSLIFRVLNQKYLRLLGVLSYSLYLVHASVIDVVDLHVIAPGWAKAGLAFLASFILAFIMHRFVELPFQRLRQRFQPRKSAYPPALTSVEIEVPRFPPPNGLLSGADTLG